MAAVNSVAHLLEGLTFRRAAAVTALSGTVAVVLGSSGVFTNALWELVVIALCVGYTSMLLFTVAGNMPQRRVPRPAMQVLGVVLGSIIGTVLGAVVRGTRFADIVSERLMGASVTIGLGVGIGCVIIAAGRVRETRARDAARLAEAEAERQRLEKNVLHARLQLLQAQVEPHFLFNTLANVQHLVATDPPSAERVLASLIRYLRAALPRMRASASTLGREIDMARAFLEIHQVRMGSRLEFAIDMPEALRERPFPPMMLISLVENALKHGVDPCCECGRIEIRAGERAGRVRLCVADTGEGMNAKAGAGVGLTNIRERLKALYGADARLVLEENRPRGVVASIEVPT